MGTEPPRPPIILKLKNPPPRPDPELQLPMIIDPKADEKKMPSFVVRYLISCLIVCLFLMAVVGFSILCTFQPAIGVGLLAVFFVLIAAYPISTDDHFW